MTRPLSFIYPGFFVGVRFCVVYVLISCILFAKKKSLIIMGTPYVLKLSILSTGSTDIGTRPRALFQSFIVPE